MSPTPIPPAKECSDCKTMKPLTSEYWYRDKSKPDGFRTLCIVCTKMHRNKSYNPAIEQEKREQAKEFVTKLEKTLPTIEEESPVFRIIRIFFNRWAERNRELDRISPGQVDEDLLTIRLCKSCFDDGVYRLFADYGGWADVRPRMNAETSRAICHYCQATVEHHIRVNYDRSKPTSPILVDSTGYEIRIHSLNQEIAEREAKNPDDPQIAMLRAEKSRYLKVKFPQKSTTKRPRSYMRL